MGAGSSVQRKGSIDSTSTSGRGPLSPTSLSWKDGKQDNTERSVRMVERIAPPMSLLPLNVLEDIGHFPRHSENKTVLLKDINRDKAIIIFVSHRWLRAGLHATDDEKGSKYTLLVEGLRKLFTYKYVPEGKDIFLWFDYCCIDQEKKDKELAHLLSFMSQCHLIFTPIVDPDWNTWHIDTVYDLFSDYKAKGWQDYWERGWCRLEAFIGTNAPVDQQGSEGLGYGLFNAIHCCSRRPHLIYGTRESRLSQPPRVLPPLRNSYLRKYSPKEGKLTVESDRESICALLDEIHKYIPDPPQEGWTGARDANKLPDGEGVFHFSNGNRYEGRYKSGVQHGKGTFYFAQGDTHTGLYKGDLRHGIGIYYFNNGNKYTGGFLNHREQGYGEMFYADGGHFEGTFVNGKKSGTGHMTYASGDELEGEFIDGLAHGPCTLLSANGDKYVGEYVEGQKHGIGTISYANGEKYSGDFEQGFFHGKGTFWYKSGDKYVGEFQGGEWHGHGNLCYANGDKYFGEFVNGVKHGQGKYLLADGSELLKSFDAGKISQISQHPTATLSTSR